MLTRETIKSALERLTENELIDVYREYLGANDYYDEKEAARELEKIREWLHQQAKSGCGLVMLEVSARFGNGETWYTEVQ